MALPPRREPGLNDVRHGVRVGQRRDREGNRAVVERPGVAPGWRLGVGAREVGVYGARAVEDAGRERLEVVLGQRGVVVSVKNQRETGPAGLAEPGEVGEPGRPRGPGGYDEERYREETSPSPSTSGPR